MRGDVSLADLSDYGIKLDADTETYNSVAGLVFDKIGHLPRPGDEVAVEGFTLTVEAVNGNRIESVRVSRTGESSTASLGI